MLNLISHTILDSSGVFFLNADLQGMTFGYFRDGAPTVDLTLDQALAAVGSDMVDVSDLSDLNPGQLDQLIRWLASHGADDLAHIVISTMI